MDTRIKIIIKRRTKKSIKKVITKLNSKVISTLLFIVFILSSFAVSANFSYAYAEDEVDIDEIYADEALVGFDKVGILDCYSVFVERLYINILERDVDEFGREHWMFQLERGYMTMADVAANVFGSQEFLDANHPVDVILEKIYMTMLDREPDVEGIKYWSQVIEPEKNIKEVVYSFADSPEFGMVCRNFKYPNEYNSVMEFVKRLYVTVLGREFDEGGKNYWAKLLIDCTITGYDAVKYFFNSEEYLAKNSSDGEFLTTLYNTVLEREPDEEGYNFWISVLEKGYDRENVIDGFCYSPEFKELCSSFGIIPYIRIPADNIGYIFVGDSRFYDLAWVIRPQDMHRNYYVISNPGCGYDCLYYDDLDKIEEIKRSRNDIAKWVIVSNYGYNDLGNANKYRYLYEYMAKKGDSVYFASVTPSAEGVTYSNSEVSQFNNALKNIPGVKYIDVYTHMMENGFETSDMIHYTERQNRLNFYYILENIE